MLAWQYLVNNYWILLKENTEVQELDLTLEKPKTSLKGHKSYR